MRRVQSSPPLRCFVGPLIAHRRRHQELEKNAAVRSDWLRRETYLLLALRSRNSSLSTAQCCPDSGAYAATFLRGTRLTVLLRPPPLGALSVGLQHGLFLCGLTFELRWPRRCGALGLRRKIGRRPGAAGPVCHAVGAQLERGVRRHLLWLLLLKHCMKPSHFSSWSSCSTNAPPV
jgi:hypothetical protein